MAFKDAPSSLEIIPSIMIVYLDSIQTAHFLPAAEAVIRVRKENHDFY